MLTVFVQQGCQNPDGTVSSCTFYQKTSSDYAPNQSYWPRMVLAWNCITLITFMFTNMALFLRERFVIKYFDHTKYEPPGYLHGEGKLDTKGLLTFEHAASWLQPWGLGWFVTAMQSNALGNTILGFIFSSDRVSNELRRYPRIKSKLDVHNTWAFFLSALCFSMLNIKCVPARGHGNPRQQHAPSVPLACQ